MWLILEGIDRSGKSTVAELFKKDGFEVVHLNAPDKRFTQPGYTGPSYADEILEMLMEYDGKNVVFDRSHYGEFVWPHVYGRKSQLTKEDIEVFQDYEKRNDTQKILMIDNNVEAHWHRCVENKEPLDRSQFVKARNRYNKLAHDFGFIPRTLGDFDEKLTRNQGESDTTLEKSEPLQDGETKTTDAPKPVISQNKSKPVPQEFSTADQLQEKLEKANAINSILSKRIVKQKGDIFDAIETDIKLFLNKRLSEIMGTDKPESANKLTSSEVQMLKTLCKQWESKLKG